MHQFMYCLVCLVALGFTHARGADNPLQGDKLPPGAVMRYGTDDLRDPAAHKVLFLPDGKTLVSAGWSLRIWDLPTRKLRAEYPIPGMYASHLSCSPTGDTLYLGCTKFLLINPANGKVVATIDPPEGGWCSTAVSPDGKRLAAGGYAGEIVLWELPSGKRLAFKGKHEYPADAPPRPKDPLFGTEKILAINSMSFHPSKPLLASGGTDDVVRVWDLKTGVLLSLFDKNVGGRCTFTPDGKHLVTDDKLTNEVGSRTTSKLLFWDLASGKVAREVESQWGLDIVWSHDGTRFAAGYSPVLHDLATGKVLHRTPPELGRLVSSVGVSPNGDTIALVAKGLHVWDTRTGRSLIDPVGHTGMILATRLSPDGTRFATASSDGTVCVWDVKTGRQIQKLSGPENPIHSVAFVPGEDVVVAGSSERLTFLDVVKGKVLRTIAVTRTAQHIEYIRDGRALFVGCSHLGIQIFDADTGQYIDHAGGDAHRDYGGRLCFLHARNGKFCVRPTAAMQGNDAGFIIESFGAGRAETVIGGPGERITTAALSPDDKILAYGGKEVTLYDIAKKEKIGTISTPCYGVMRYTPDGKRLFLGNTCYDVQTRKKLFALPAEVECLELSADGKRAFTANRAHSSALVWDLEAVQKE